MKIGTIISFVGLAMLVSCTPKDSPTEPSLEGLKLDLVPASSETGISAVELPTLGGTRSRALGINNSGIVVGSCQTASGSSHACLWNGNSVTDLGALNEDWTNEAWAVNESGMVVGTSYWAYGGARGFVWKDGVMTDLGTLGGSDTWAQGINDLGQIVGRSTAASGEEQAFIWKDGIMTALSSPGPDSPPSSAYGINNIGDVVGMVGSGVYSGGHPVVWIDGQISDLPLGTYRSGMAVRINDQRKITGVVADENYTTHAVYWEAAQELSLHTLGGKYSEGIGINSFGQIVGSNSKTAYWQPNPVLWYGQHSVDLGFPSGADYWYGWASDINDVGMAVGYYVHGGGQTQAVLWTISVESVAHQIHIQLDDLLASGILNQGQAHSLARKLDQATDLKTKLKYAESLEVMRGFIAQVNDLTSDLILTGAQGDVLVESADFLVSILEADAAY